VTGAKRHGTGQPDGDADSFDVTLRGYDRRQVDDRLAHLGAALAAADEALTQAQRRNSELNGQLRLALDRLRQAGDAGARSNSFGFRVEKILRLAEEEARMAREKGAATAAVLVERARAEAQAIRDQARRWRADAIREAEQIRKRAHADADKRAAEVEAALARRSRTVEQELDRLVALRDQVRTELVNVRETVWSALGHGAGPPPPGWVWPAQQPPSTLTAAPQPVPQSLPQPLPPPVRRAGAAPSAQHTSGPVG
jgi:cell division septum initiation protein DivIVA